MRHSSRRSRAAHLRRHPRTRRSGFRPLFGHPDKRSADGLRRRTMTTLQRRGRSRMGCLPGGVDRLAAGPPIWQPRDVPISCSTSAAGRKHDRGGRAPGSERWRPASASTSRNQGRGARAGRPRRRGGDLRLRRRADLPVRAGKLRPDRVAIRRDVFQDSVEAFANLRRAARDGGELRMIVGAVPRTTRS